MKDGETSKHGPRLPARGGSFDVPPGWTLGPFLLKAIAASLAVGLLVLVVTGSLVSGLASIAISFFVAQIGYLIFIHKVAQKRDRSVSHTRQNVE